MEFNIKILLLDILKEVCSIGVSSLKMSANQIKLATDEKKC